MKITNVCSKFKKGFRGMTSNFFFKSPLNILFCIGETFSSHSDVVIHFWIVHQLKINGCDNLFTPIEHKNCKLGRKIMIRKIIDDFIINQVIKDTGK